MLGYAIIGCGRIFRNHASSVRANEHARLVAVADVRPEALEHATDEFDADAYTDYEEMLRRADVDVVSVCLPHHLHEPAVLAAAHAGKHVLCEKPIALDRGQALRMIHACRRAGLRLGVVLQNRYNEATERILRAIEQGRFGKFVAGTMLQAVHKEPSYYQDNWHGRWATEGGGALLTQSIHTLDLLCLFLGRPAGIKAHFDTIVHDIEVEDVCSASIRFENAAAAGVTVTNSALQAWWQRLDILGTHGTVTVEDNRITRWDFASDRPEDSDVGTEDALEKSIGARGYGTGHHRIINDFISSIIEDRPFRIPGEEALKASEVIWAAYRSSRSGDEEKITFPEPARTGG
ncbi:MAG: Gfo/Idh/MocA family oxidoreductase [Planctomycetes bacterium]|nr:Gfo/Idh/MocA family oxidoreductase [Planctomycetota bacterium]